MYLFVDWYIVFVEACFQLSFCLSNVLFIASAAFYHVYNVSRTAVNAVDDSPCVSYRVKCVISIGCFVIDVFACMAAVVAATKEARRLVRQGVVVCSLDLTSKSLIFLVCRNAARGVALNPLAQR